MSCAGKTLDNLIKINEQIEHGIVHYTNSQD